MGFWETGKGGGGRKKSAAAGEKPKGQKDGRAKDEKAFIYGKVSLASPPLSFSDTWKEIKDTPSPRRAQLPVKRSAIAI